MLFGKREPRSLDVRRRGAFRPIGEDLERRELLAVINLGGAPPGSGTDNIATPPARTTILPLITGDKTNIPPGTQNVGPYGVDLAGTVAGQSAGVSVSDVGDVNADGFDDFVVGAPSVTQAGGTPGSALPSVYLIFGSKTTTAGAISDWLNINSNFNGGESPPVGVGRVGNLSQLGNAQTAQQDPYNGLGVGIGGVPYSYPFAGVKFVTSLTSRSELGESAAPAFGFNKERGFMIGAPGPHDPVTTANGSGRAFLISGAATLNNLIGQTVDLDQLGSSGITNLNVTTFVSSSTRFTNARIGQSVAGVGDAITDGFPDIAIGAPNANITGIDAGAVAVISGVAIPSGFSTIDLANVGQGGANGIAGVLFAGSNAGDQAGWSLAFAGNVNNGLSNGNLSIDDFLIGAPATVSGAPGSAYLVYGAVNLPLQAIATGGINYINLNRIGDNTIVPPATVNTNVLGLAIQGTNGGDLTGWAVSSAGDFNGDTVSDIMIGSPGAAAASGRVDLFYGSQFQANTTPTSTPYPLGALVGRITLGVTTTLQSATFVGGAFGDLAGYSVSQTGKIRSGNGNPILIGAPGYINNNGEVYLLPSNTATLTGLNSLADANVDGTTLAGTRLQFTNPGASSQPFFGASVSGRLTLLGQTSTADGDLVGDFIIGAPGYQATTGGSNRAGGAMILEGAFVPLRLPAAINTQIGVEKPFGPFNNINPSTPNALAIYVFSVAATATTPAFSPLTDINPATISVNGVAFPTATLSPTTPADLNGDGIPDAIVTISPRSNLGLTANTSSLTLTGRTRASSAQPNTAFTGTATITVLGGGGGGGGGSSSAAPITFSPATTFQPPFGTDRWVPQISSLSRLGSYKPIPLRVALQQWSPPAGFNTRIDNFYNPKKEHHQFGYGASANHGHRTSSLGYGVFTRSKFKAGKTQVFTHEVKVVPSNLQTERFGSTPNTTRHPKK